MENNSNFFERLQQFIINQGFKNTNEFAKHLGWKSPEKLYRLERKENAKPSYDIIKDISNKFENIDLRWLITGKSVNTPSDKSVDTFQEQHEKYNTLSSTEEKLHPKQPKKLHPTLHPTPKMELPKVVTVDKSGNENIVMVPVAARAGYLMGYGDIEYIKELPTYHVPRLQNGTFRAFEVDGHSMTPTITHGDIVFAEWVEKFEHITDDRVYVIITKTDGIVIKRVLNRVEQYGFLVAKSDSITNKRQYPNLNIPPKEVLEIWSAKMCLGADFSSPHSMWDRINDLEADIEFLKGKKD